MNKMKIHTMYWGRKKKNETDIKYSPSQSLFPPLLAKDKSTW